MRLSKLFFLFLLFSSIALADDSNSPDIDVNSAPPASEQVIEQPNEADTNSQGTAQEQQNSLPDANSSIETDPIIDSNSAVVIDSNTQLQDSNAQVDLNASIDTNTNVPIDSGSVQIDMNVSADANTQAPIVPQNSAGTAAQPSIDQNTQSAQSGLDLLAQFFSQGITDLFGGLKALLPLDSLLGGFIDVSGESKKDFTLNESVVEINGELAKCIGAACDEVPQEVE